MKKTQNRDLLDVMRISVNGNPEDAIRKNLVPQNIKNVKCDVLIVGGGTGGIAAALSVASLGKSVCLTEETDWIGGQLTAHGISEFDEHLHIEFAGGTKTYYQLRNGIRDYYHQNYVLSEEAKKEKFFNPGTCWVSRLAFEPKIGLSVLNQLLDPHKKNGLLSIYLRTKIHSAECELDSISNILTYNFDSGEWIRFHPKYVLDATEIGDVIPLVGAEYVSGYESKAQTGEPHARDVADPECVQPITYPFILEHRSKENHSIPKPPQYERFRDSHPYSLGPFSFIKGGSTHPRSLLSDTYKVLSKASEETGGSFWSYRRLIDHEKFLDSFPHDIAMFNWPGNDYGKNIIDKPLLEQALIHQEAKALSLGMLYWLQFEVPRDDGGKGYPEFLLRKDIIGTQDGLSKHPYIRESRRIKALKTIVEQDISSVPEAPTARGTFFSDSVGIGFYPIDIHPSYQDKIIEGAIVTELKDRKTRITKPFQIPMGSLIPIKITNLLAANKNLGTPHLTNGAYRLHPVEWNIGESAGALAAYAINSNHNPKEIYGDKSLTLDFQHVLLDLGIPIYWFLDIPVSHPSFKEIQISAITGENRGSPNNLLYDQNKNPKMYETHYEGNKP